MDGLLIPGGFGERGVEGKIAAIRYAREQRIPFLGICFGMQLAVIEYARNVLGLRKASSTEWDHDTPDPVIALMSEQEGVEDLGGTMRLGSYPAALKEGSLARRLYGAPQIDERHRHRWELNNLYREPLEQAGLSISGASPDGRLVEMIELPSHPFFIASQFHPELKSRPERPHPLFDAFVGAAAQCRLARTTLAAGREEG
jgi:CTP synthase